MHAITVTINTQIYSLNNNFKKYQWINNNMNINKTIKYQAIFIYLNFNHMRQIYFFIV